MTQDQRHPIALDLSEPLPAELDLGATFTLAVAIATTSGCDLAGATFKVVQAAETVAEGTLPPITRHDAASDDRDPRNGPIDRRDVVRVALTAPCEIGEFRWTLVLPGQEIAGIDHAEASLSFSFRTSEHRTSLAVWDVPSPVMAGERFTLKVGAKCTACCCLTGRQVEIRDGDGAARGVVALGEMATGEAEGLHSATVDVIAPTTEGLHDWSVTFAPTHLALPHQGASATFSFATVGAGIHDVSVAVLEEETASPIGDAQVRLGFHRTATDGTGVARFRVSPGEHRLFVWKTGYATPERIVTVAQDLELCIEAHPLPRKDPYARWQG